MAIEHDEVVFPTPPLPPTKIHLWVDEVIKECKLGSVNKSMASDAGYRVLGYSCSSLYVIRM